MFSAGEAQTLRLYKSENECGNVIQLSCDPTLELSLHTKKQQQTNSQQNKWVESWVSFLFIF